MTGDELKKLNRSDLLEMLLELANENKRLQSEIDELQTRLADRDLKCENLGSIAEASLALNGIFEAADKAAAQYLENAQRKAAEIIENAQRESERLIESADEIIEEAADDADEIMTIAEEYAENIMEKTQEEAAAEEAGEEADKQPGNE